ncbi:MAG: hypothetical protein AB7G75_29890 [Candidatus Binatia bacterium]
MPTLYEADIALKEAIASRDIALIAWRKVVAFGRHLRKIRDRLQRADPLDEQALADIAAAIERNYQETTALRLPLEAAEAAVLVAEVAADEVKRQLQLLSEKLRFLEETTALTATPALSDYRVIQRIRLQMRALLGFDSPPQPPLAA